jgi:hydrogenase maturation protease
LRERIGAAVAVLAVEGEATEVMSGWAGCGVAIIIDAVYSGEPPGHVHRLDAASGPLPRELFRLSTHAFGVAEAIELGRALGMLPKRIVVFGIEGRNFDAGSELTPSVAAVVDEVVERILREIDERAD